MVWKWRAGVDEARAPVFVSIGRHGEDAQHEFVDCMVRALEGSGLSPRLPSLRRSGSEEPLQRILMDMRRCYGVVVIAYPRWHFALGHEIVETALETELGVRTLPSVWLQVEAAMAYALGLPLLILVDERIHGEGMVNLRHPSSFTCSYSLDTCKDGLPTDLEQAVAAFSDRTARFMQLHLGSGGR